MTQKKINWLGVYAFVLSFLVLGLGYVAVTEEVQEVVPDGYTSPTELEFLILASQKALAEKDTSIAELNLKITGLNEQVVVVEEEEERSLLGYILDKLGFGVEVNKILSDREVYKLLDTEVEFNGDEYDVEEVVTLSKMDVRVNDEDFEGNPYLVVPSESIEYTVVFDSSLNTSLISEDETMKFNFLGEELEVSEWDVDEVTFTQGEEYYLEQGETVEVDGKTVLLKIVLDNSVYVMVGDKGAKIREGETAKINGLEIRVSEVLNSGYAGGYFQAELVIGTDVETTIEDGDEFEEDSIWEYRVTANSIGLVLVEEFMDLDDDLKPLNVDEKLCLPNEYVCVRYNGFIEEDTEEISFELKTKKTAEYVEIRGNFQSGLKDYDRLYINESGIFDEDYKGIVDVTIGDFELTISLNNKVIEIKDLGNVLFDVNLDLNVSSVGNKDVDYRTLFGILVNNPEDAVDDQEWNIVVPEVALENTLTVL